MHALGLAGILACGLGFGILLFFLLAHILHHLGLGLLANPRWDIHDRPALSLGILLIVVGVQFFSIGLLGELLITAPRATDKPYSVQQVLGDEPGKNHRPEAEDAEVSRKAQPE